MIPARVTPLPPRSAGPRGAGADNQADAGADNKPAQQDEQSLVEEQQHEVAQR